MLTAEWMPDGAVAKCVDTVVEYILDEYEYRHGNRELGDRQIVVGLEALPLLGPDQYAALYYLVDPEKECVFWLEKYSISWEISQETEAQLESQLIGLFLRYQF